MVGDGEVRADDEVIVGQGEANEVIGEEIMAMIDPQESGEEEKSNTLRWCPGCCPS